MQTTSNKPISLKLHKRIILTFILTTVFAIIFVGSTLRYVLEKTTMDNWKKRQEFVTLEFAPQCNHEIQEAKRDLEFVSKMAAFSKLSHIDQIDPSIKGIPENVDVEKREIFRDLMALGERFSSLIILAPNANLYLAHPFKTQLKIKRLNFADRPYFKEAVRTKKPFISDSFINAAGNPVVVIAVPVLNKAGDITAIIGGGVYLTNLSRLVDKKVIGTFDLGFIVDRKGRIIAHTNTKLLQKEIRNRYIEHALVSKFLHKSSHDSSKVMIEDCVDPVDGKHYLTSFVQLQSGWGLGLALSRETVLSEIRPAVWRITIIVSLIILLVGTIGVFFAQWIGRRWIGTEKSLVKHTHDLGERVKELNCLFEISKLIENPDISLEVICQGVVDLIPPSWQYPEITCSRMLLEDKEYKTGNFKETAWKQSGDIFVFGKRMGVLEICHLEERPEIDEGPFLKEERDLIDAITERLGEFVLRKQAEKALRESEAQKAAILNGITTNLAFVNENLEILWTNKTSADSVNRTMDEIIGQKCHELWADPETPCDGCPTVKAFKTRKTEQTIMRTPDGRVWDEKGEPVFDENGDIMGVLQIAHDITEKVNAEEELRASEERLARSKKMEAMGLMAGGVAHDLNNILSGIVSYPELLLMDLPEDSPLRKPIKTIQESGMRAADVVEDLLTIARGVVSSKEVLNLNALVEEYLNSAEHHKLKKIHPLSAFKTELDSELLNITCSASHVKKILMNLIVNASEAIEGRGTVTVSTINRYLDEPLKGYEDVRRGEYVVLGVSDDGSGISPQDFDRIFEPFYTKKVMGRSGTGLGLAVVWNSMQDHDGYINVKSSEKGTVFELYFPTIREQAADEREPIPLEDYLGHGEKILVVDDEERQREIASGILTKLGYNPEAVSSGEEAIEHIKENTVDLIVLDMVLPKGINGRETYQQIIKIRPGQKAIIASGYAKTKEVDIAQELGADKYIRKPYTLEEIGVAVKKELEK